MMPAKRIDKGNYEEFFLLYVDNELPAADREAVDSFVSAHPELREELELLLETRLIPEEQLFGNPEVLMKPERAARRNTYLLLRWLAPAAAAVWLLFTGISQFGGSVDGPPLRPPIKIASQEPVTKPAAPRKTDTPARIIRIPEKRPLAVPTDKLSATTAPLAVTEAAETVDPGTNITETVIESAAPVLVPAETIQTTSVQQTAVKNNYASEALFHPDGDAEAEEEQGRSKKGFRVLVRKATRVYQKVVEPEGDKPLIRLSKADIEL